jgi:hypothetical protein
MRRCRKRLRFRADDRALTPAYLVDTMSSRAFVIAVAVALAAAPASAFAAEWSGPVRVPGRAGLTVPHVGMTASDEAIVMWRDGGRIDATVRSRTGRFSAAQRLVQVADAYAVRAERLAVGPDGTAVVVWAQVAKRSPHYRVMAAVRRPHGRFGRARLIGGASSVFQSNPQAAVDRHGNAVVVWWRREGVRIAVAPAGKDFGALRTLRGWGGQLAIAFAADDRLHAAFTQGAVVYATSARRPYRFAAPRKVSAGNGYEPALAAGPAGSMTIAFRDGSSDSSESIGQGGMWAAVASAGGAFGMPFAVSPPGITGREPVLAGGPRGVLVSWDKFGGGSPVEPPATAPVYAWLTAGTAAGSWLPPQPLAAPGDWTSVPGMAVDARGIATVAYMRPTTATTRTLVVRSGPIGTALGAEQVLDERAGTAAAHPFWYRAAVATSGRTTLIVWSPPGARMVAFSRTA